MSALSRFFASGHAKPALSDEVEAAVNEVLKEAKELCQLLREPTRRPVERDA